MPLFLLANLVTTSKALVTRSDALVPSSVLAPSNMINSVRTSHEQAWSEQRRRVHHFLRSCWRGRLARVHHGAMSPLCVSYQRKRE